MSFQSFVKGASDWLKQQDTGSGVVNPPLTQTASSHSIIIKNSSGLKIGRIQSWSPNMARTVDTLFEVQGNATGEPIERVPQVQTSNSISVQRYELYSTHIGEAFGVKLIGDNDDLFTLILQKNAIHIRELWRDPFGGMRGYAYVNCWFSNIGQTISATDDRIIKASATVEFTRKVRLI